ncbi:MAG: carbohydrate ABC transporter permease [Candidatus Izemoplasmatales bacterium]|jgi:multiple sugar transport system permease protein|nr:carbohydrate ABC transporter permease [bacterium]MDZ4197254.1 carbohydrate ABC transporter permease [Candidatus Izemoplasmatales bacterium]
MNSLLHKHQLKKLFLGRRGNDGLLFKIVLYLLLIGISFIFLYPLLSMLSMSLMSVEDLVDSSISWVPRNPTLRHFESAFVWMKFWESFLDSLQVSIYPTIATVVSSALIGYGFGRFEFPLKKLLMGLMIAMFLIPSVLTYIPTTVLYRDLKIFGIDLQLMNSIRAFWVPALVGNGIRQTIFILIFYQFFKMIPHELIEAASMDGSGPFRTFLTIAIPMAAPAFLICGLYSFVWYWNETTLARLYFGSSVTTLPMRLESFIAMYRSMYAQGKVTLDTVSSIYNTGVQYAMTLLSILPLLVIYIFAQKWFVEGVDKSGIAGS